MTSRPTDGPTGGPTSSPTGLAGVVLAAGAGTRLRPLTLHLPKALCPVDGVPLVDLALDRLEPLAGSGSDHLAVNAHHHAGLVAEHCRDRAHVSVEAPVALGTAGALGALRDWIDGRDVVLTNADSYLPGGLAGFTDGWDGERCRLLCRPALGSERADFADPRADVADPRAARDSPGVRYVGACLLPWRLVRTLSAVPSGLYETLWRATPLDLHVAPDLVAVDCGTPRDYLLANLHAAGGRSVVAPSAQVLGSVDRCVVWPGAAVGADERLVEVVRAGTAETPLTVDASAVPALEALRRWEDSGAYWRVLERDRFAVTLSLITCTGDEEVSRLVSGDAALLDWLGDRTTNLP